MSPPDKAFRIVSLFSLKTKCQLKAGVGTFWCLYFPRHYGESKKRCLTPYLRGRVYCSPFPRVCFMRAVLMLMAHSTGGSIKVGWWRWMLLFFLCFFSWLFSYRRRLQGQLKPEVCIHHIKKHVCLFSHYQSQTVFSFVFVFLFFLWQRCKHKNKSRVDVV